MKYICVNCNEEFYINKSEATICPYCNFPIIEKKKYEKLKDELNNTDFSKENLEKVLDSESEVYEKIKGTILEKVLEDIKAMYELLKSPKEGLRSKAISVLALLYVLNPLDVIPDIMPALGVADDVGVVLLAVTSLENTLKKYKDVLLKDKLELNKPNRTVVYQLNKDPFLDETIARYKKNLLIWNIPINKKNDLYTKLMGGKIIDGNEVYVLNHDINESLVPFNNFDQYISDNIFSEAMTVFKALGVKKINYVKKTITTSNKKRTATLKVMNIGDGEHKKEIEDVNIQEYKNESIFEKIDLAESLKNTEFIDKLIWYFSDKSIVDETVFRERFEQGLIKKKILKELDCNSVLDTNNRANIKKYCEIKNDVNISKNLKISWNIEVEYYSLADIDKSELKLIYSNIVEKINERRKELIKF